ncbi:uncharacterized protein LOC132892432 isoform X2 [Neoarius graeffei]|nr:uncharacterized protein LOC132892432 isoform X2 [Neoarius graeffei]XP_060786709.1 uncharacterized protein LOC132892432 isoform X2 [Neoarius graeffei]
METAEFYMARTVDRPKRLVSKTAQPLQHAAKKQGSARPAGTPAKSKVRLVRKKSAVTVATAGSRTDCFGLYKEEIRIMKKRLDDMDNRLKTVSRELEVEKQFRKAVEDRAKAEERFKKVEELLQRLVNPPPAAAQLTRPRQRSPQLTRPHQHNHQHRTQLLVLDGNCLSTPLHQPLDPGSRLELPCRTLSSGSSLLSETITCSGRANKEASTGQTFMPQMCSWL